MIKQAREEVVAPRQGEVIEELRSRAHALSDVPVLCRTHGQPATPSTLGKEMANTVYRLSRQWKAVKETEVLGKFNGATGNYAAHGIAYPQVHWPSVAEEFVTSYLGLAFNPYTTQIEPHDFVAELGHAMMRFNNVLLDFDRDMWTYVMLGYFQQRAVEGEIGSSTMPHKVNPIDFENSEGNIGLAHAIFDHLATKLPVSRLQRDLSDSTVMRNIGVGFAYSLTAYASTLKGLSRVDANQQALLADLDRNWEVLAEPIQTVMRKYDVAEPYEKLKALTRGKRVSGEGMAQFLDTQMEGVPAEEVERLRQLAPHNYVGFAKELAKAV
jgi:adenylosuccinate lyase